MTDSEKERRKRKRARKKRQASHLPKLIAERRNKKSLAQAQAHIKREFHVSMWYQSLDDYDSDDSRQPTSPDSYYGPDTSEEEAELQQWEEEKKKMKKNEEKEKKKKKKKEEKKKKKNEEKKKKKNEEKKDEEEELPEVVEEEVQEAVQREPSLTATELRQWLIKTFMNHPVGQLGPSKSALRYLSFKNAEFASNFVKYLEKVPTGEENIRKGCKQPIVEAPDWTVGKILFEVMEGDGQVPNIPDKDYFLPFFPPNTKIQKDDIDLRIHLDPVFKSNFMDWCKGFKTTNQSKLVLNFNKFLSFNKLSPNTISDLKTYWPKGYKVNQGNLNNFREFTGFNEAFANVLVCKNLDEALALQTLRNIINK